MLTVGLECPAYLGKFWHFSPPSTFDASGIIYKVIFHTSKINCSAYEKRMKKKKKLLIKWACLCHEGKLEFTFAYYLCISLILSVLTVKHNMQICQFSKKTQACPCIMDATCQASNTLEKEQLLTLEINPEETLLNTIFFDNFQDTKYCKSRLLVCIPPFRLTWLGLFF